MRAGVASLALSCAGAALGCSDEPGAAEDSSSSAEDTAAAGAAGGNGTRADGGGPGGSTHGGSGAGGGGCLPAPGDSHYQASCDEVELAVMGGAGSVAALRVAGRISGGAADEACFRVAEIDLLRGDGTVAQTLDGQASLLASARGFWGAAPSEPEVASACDGDEGRVEPYGIVVRGTTDGGTFEARCGKADSGSSWPPDVLRTCHQGLETPPPYSTTAQVMVTGAYASASMYTAFDAPPTVVEVDGDVRILPASWMGPPLTPFDTSGWDATPQAQFQGGVQVSFSMADDPFGEEICPVPADMPGPDSALPIFVARVAGQTEIGPFVSEVYIRGCQRIVTQ
jgi:hypothetical protein